MRVYVYEGGGEFGEACCRLARELAFADAREQGDATVAIAPLLARRLSALEYSAPAFGTLIFHPSALPYRRGPDAVRRAVESRERVSAATWFWCAERWDAGDICEQETVVLHPGESAGRAYHGRFVPAGLRALRRALEGVARGRPRRVPQDESLATYEPRLQAAPA